MTSWIRKSSNWYRLRKEKQQREPESPQIARRYRLVLCVAPADIVSEKWLKRIACLPACLPRLAPVLPRFSGQVLPELSSPPLGIRPSGARHASIRRGLGMPDQGESRVSRHLCTGWPPLCGAAALCE